MHCSNCGSPIHVGQNFCGGCGGSISHGAQPQAAHDHRATPPAVPHAPRKSKSKLGIGGTVLIVLLGTGFARYASRSYMHRQITKDIRQEQMSERNNTNHWLQNQTRSNRNRVVPTRSRQPGDSGTRQRRSSSNTWNRTQLQNQPAGFEARNRQMTW